MHLLTIQGWIAGLSFCLGTVAVQVANFNVSQDTAAQYGCDASCYETFSAALALDAERYGALYDEDFYATAANFNSSKPGDLLKFAPYNTSNLTTIPAGTTAYRIQYVSQDIHGRSVPVTGFVALPWAGRGNEKTFPVIAYAHGTSGTFRGCAPSVMPDLDDYGSWSILLKRGYAIVATDYSGLGNGYIGHQYVASPAQANDLYYSIAAAHKALPHILRQEWMSVGHSQGGGAVWALAESHLLRQNPLHLGRYLGTVPQAPGVRVKELALAAMALSADGGSGGQGVLGELAWVVFGLRSTNPSDNQTWLRPEYRKRLELAELTQACYYSVEALSADLDVTDAVDIADPGLYKALDLMQNFTDAGDSKSYGPMLIIQGLADEAVLPSVVETSFAASCKTGNDVHLQLYPGVQHDAVIPVAAPSFLQWIDDRFDHIPICGRCVNETIAAVDPANVYLPEIDD